MIKGVAFTYYPVTDIAAARRFYEGTLGLVSQSSEQSPWVEYDLPDGACFAITTVVADQPSSTAGGTVSFEVEDLPAFVARLQAAGVRLGHSELIRGPSCCMMPIYDPDGNSILLHQLD